MSAVAQQLNSAEWTEALTASCFSLDWSSSSSGSSEGGLRSLHGQSRMTLNLTSASPVLITCRPDSAAASAAAVGKASGLDGQTDHVSGIVTGVVQISHFLSAPRPAGVILGVLIPVQVTEGGDVHGEAAVNHSTAKGRGNYRPQCHHVINHFNQFNDFVFNGIGI